MTDTIWIETDIVIKAFGGEAEGKGHLTRRLKLFLEKEGFKVTWNPSQDVFALRVKYKYGVNERMEGINYNGELIV